MQQKNFFLIPAFILFFTLCVVPAACLAGNVHLSFVRNNVANPGKVSLVIDRSEKIAGLKLTLVYDRKGLSFKKVDRTKATSSFMHVVNDKNPGKLIIVMASARGISGENVALFDLEFSGIAEGAVPKGTISVTQVELMDENLQEITGDKPEFSF